MIHTIHIADLEFQMTDAEMVAILNSSDSADFLTGLLFNFCFFRSRTFILLHLLFSSSLFCLSFWIIFHKVSVDVVLKIILSLDHHLHVIQNFIIRVFLLPIFLNDLLILFWLTLLWLSRFLKVRLYLTFLNIVVILHHTCELDDLTPYL